MNGDTNLNDFTYEVTEVNADPLEAVITKGNITASFTPHQMIVEQDACERQIKQLKATYELKKSECENVEKHHPFIKDLSIQQLFTAHFYYERKALVDGLPEKIAEFEKQLQDSKDEYKLIAEKLGLDILPKTNEEVVDEAVAKIVDAPVEPPKENE